MKTISIFLFIICVSTTFAQPKINILDENVNSKYPTIIFEKMDGSIFELNGKSTWTVHKLMPTSKEFARLVRAKRPLTVQYETINGNKYTTTNGGQWKKEARIYGQQASLEFTANYRNQENLLDVMFALSTQTKVELNLHSVYGETIFSLHNKLEQVGQHRLMLPVSNIPRGEYMLVLQTPQKVETLRISISN